MEALNYKTKFKQCSHLNTNLNDWNIDGVISVIPLNTVEDVQYALDNKLYYYFDKRIGKMCTFASKTEHPFLFEDYGKNN